ncbi:TetR/AcrR family transcriptional regulator [Agromyces soli]
MPDTITGRRRRGRPRGGGSDARSRILHAAAQEFGEFGYDGATIRSIAAKAGVDTALVHHYFGTKSDLFAAVIDVPLNPAALLPAMLGGELDTAGERIVRTVLEIWENPSFRPRGVAVLRSVIGNRRSASLMVGFVSREILKHLSERIGPGRDADRRAALVASQIVGLVVTRYVLELPALAEASPAEVVSAVGPTIQRYLTGEVGPAE